MPKRLPSHDCPKTVLLESCFLVGDRLTLSYRRSDSYETEESERDAVRRRVEGRAASGRRGVYCVDSLPKTCYGRLYCMLLILFYLFRPFGWFHRICLAPLLSVQSLVSAALKR